MKRFRLNGKGAFRSNALILFQLYFTPLHRFIFIKTSSFISGTRLNLVLYSS